MLAMRGCGGLAYAARGAERVGGLRRMLWRAASCAFKGVRAYWKGVGGSYVNLRGEVCMLTQACA